MLEAIVFDLDGVIISTDIFHYQAWKKMADGMGIYFDEKINNRLRGISRMASLEIILENYPRVLLKEEKEQLAEKKNKYYRELLSELSPDSVSDDVIETLKQLRKNGYRLAIGSSSKNAKYILKCIGLTDYFDAISDGTNITNSKPDPEVFLKAANFLKINPENCAVVEDAGDGIDAAKAAGMPAIAFGNAEIDRMADYHLAKFSDLLSVVNQINSNGE